MNALLIVRGPTDPLRIVAGLPLLRRNLLTARAAGATRLLVLTRDAAAITAALPTLWPDQPQPVIVGDAAQLSAQMGDQLTLIMEVAHVHDRRLQPLVSAARLAPDQLHAPRTTSGALGAPLIAPAALLDQRALQALLEVGVTSWRQGKEIAGVEVEADWMDVPITGDAADERRAVDALWESCRKPIDGMVSRHINRHISLFISRRIVNTGITPNHISIFCIILGVLGGVAVFQGTYASILIGASLLKANSIIDGVDGELARVKWAYSKIGELLDSMGDNVANFSFFGALTWAMWARGEQTWAMVGVAMLVMWITHLIFTYSRLRGTGRGDVMIVRQRVDELATGWLARVIDILRYKILRRDGFVMLALIMCALGLHGPLLGIMAVGAVIPIIGIVIHIAAPRPATS